MIDVITTSTRVIRHGLFDLEWIQRIDSTGGTEGWRVWCHCCGNYVEPEWLRSDLDAKTHADNHTHTVDPATALARLRHQIPPLLGNEEMA